MPPVKNTGKRPHVVSIVIKKTILISVGWEKPVPNAMRSGPGGEDGSTIIKPNSV